MKIDIDVRWMVPHSFADCVELKANSVTASHRIPTALPEIIVGGIPQQYNDILKIGQLKDKLSNTIVNHFSEIEKNRVEKFIEDYIRQTPITLDELETFIKAPTIDEITKGNK